MALTAAVADAADEAYVVSTTSPTAFVFSRAKTGGTYDLWVWDPTEGERQVSNTALTHTLAGTFALDTR